MNLMEYYIFEKNILKEEKIGLITLNIISIVFIIMGLCLMKIEGSIYVLLIFSILAVLITIISLFQYRKYPTKVILGDTEIKVFYKWKKIHSFKYEEIKYDYKDVVVRMPSIGRNSLICNCLIIHKNVELYNMMEYRSYWKDKNILIIQNKELIENFNKIIH